MSRKRQLEQDFAAKYAELNSSLLKAEQFRVELAKQVDQELIQQLDKSRQAYSLAKQRSDNELTNAITQARLLSQDALAKAGIAVSPWQDAAWNRHVPPTNGLPPSLLRIGELRLDQIHHSLLPLPALVPVTRKRHLLISFEKSQAKTASRLLESLAWRLAALSPPGTVRFILLDPLDHGASFASLLHLAESIRGSKIHSQAASIENVLLDSTIEIEDIIQRRLLNLYRDITEYNSANPNVAVPYKFIVFTGFPLGFSGRATELLQSISRSGPKAGFYLMGGVARGEKPPHGFDFSAFSQRATYVTVKGHDRLVWNIKEQSQVEITPDASPSQAIVDTLAKSINNTATVSGRPVVNFLEHAVPKAEWWKRSTQDGIESVIGLDESGKPYSITIGREGDLVQHGLVGGQNNSGKTNLLHLLILNLATTYSPEDLELYLVDFKEGVEFEGYATDRLPHAGAVVLEAEREFGLSILKYLMEEKERRGKVLKAAGAINIIEYRQVTKEPMSRILLVMDEYVVLFNTDDRLAFEASELLADLVMRGRFVGIHVLLSAQRPTSTFFNMGDIKSQIALRIAFKCRPDDSVLILGEGNDRAAKLTASGEAYVTSDPDKPDASSHLRITYVSPEQRAMYRRALRLIAARYKFSRIQPAIIFSKNAPASWLENDAIIKRLSQKKLTSSGLPTLWLGAPLRIAPDIEIKLARQSRENVLMVGSERDLAQRLLANTILGLSLSLDQDSVIACIATLSPHEEFGGSMVTLEKNLPHRLEIYQRQSAEIFIGNLVAELEKRLINMPSRNGGAIILVVGGLHQWQEARSGVSYEASPIGEHLIRLIGQGPEVGIHTIMWTDSARMIGNVVGGSEQYSTIYQFRHRIALQMDRDDSSNLIGEPLAAQLGSNRAYYRDELEPAGRIDKFKPYAWLSNAELEKTSRSIREKWL